MQGPAPTGLSETPCAWQVAVPCDRERLPGLLSAPAHPRGLVVFAHGSGSSHRSPRQRAVSEALHTAAFATLLFDLLSAAESADRRRVFDIPLLAERLLAAVAWVADRDATRGLPVGLLGASTGAAGALVAAAQEPRVRAVVSRGGRPDLAGPWLPRVHCPTLLIVGSQDTDVLALNRQALAAMRGDHRLTVVPGATHLFPEPGALDDVARRASSWFASHLRTPAAA